MSVIVRRIKAILRKYKFSGLAFVSLLGLASVFAVNIAGFLVLLPRPLWGLLDANFVTSYFMRFSILLALAFLASRYASYFLSALLGFIYGFILIVSLLVKKSGRRFIRIRGRKLGVLIARRLLIRHDLNARRGDQTTDLLSLAKWLYNSKFVRYFWALSYLAGIANGRISSHIDRYSVPVQMLSAVLVLSALFTTLTGGLILVVLGLILAFALPPTLPDVYDEGRYFESGVSYFTALKLNTPKVINIQKITLIALTVSFVSGMLHHRSLVLETKLLEFVGEVNVTGSLILAVSSGLIIHSTEGGYQFIPVEGTRVNVLAPEPEIARK